MLQPTEESKTFRTPKPDLSQAHATQGMNHHLQMYGAAGYSLEDISDGYHTFGQLYEMRLALTVALFKSIQWEDGDHGMIRKMTWRSMKHASGDMFPNYFIVGYDHEFGKVITFHYHIKAWELFDFCDTLDRAPDWDGHDEKEVMERLKNL